MRMRRRPLILSLAATVAAFALLASGCGGSGSPAVASVTASTTTTTAAQNEQNGLLAFSRCMRSNGLPSFPDPQHFAGGSVKLTIHQLGIGQSSTFQAAMGTCRQLLPAGSSNGGGGQQITPADQRDYLKAAACMRRHGFPNVPDPTFHNNQVTWNMPSSVNRNSPVAVRAVTTCRKLIPAGLPYSGS